MALSYATLAKWLDGVTISIAAGADVNAVSSQGYTPLMLAAAVGAADVAAALLHYFFAARAGDPVAQMSLAYRYYHVSFCLLFVLSSF